MNSKKAYNSIKNILLALSESDRRTILGKLSKDMKPDDKSTILLDKCKKSKVSDNKMVCPKCGSTVVVRNGKKVADSHSAYRGYAANRGTHSEQIPSGQHSKGILNFARVNSSHFRLSDLNYHHKVVSGKYCKGYLALYQWLDRYRQETTEVKRERVLQLACNKVCLFQRKNLGRKILPFDTKRIVTTPV